MNKPSLAGWRRVLVDGGVMLLPADPSVGFLRIRHREALRPLAHVIADTLGPGLGGLPAEVVGQPRVVGTDEASSRSSWRSPPAPRRRSCAATWA